MYVCGSGLTGCGAVRGAHVFECLHVDHVHQHPTLERMALVRGQLVRDRLKARQQVVLVVQARHCARYKEWKYGYMIKVEMYVDIGMP